MDTVAEFHATISRDDLKKVLADNRGPASTDWRYITTPLGGKNDAGEYDKRGPFLVTNNPTARDGFGRMSHVWVASMIHEEGGEFIAYGDGFQKLHGLKMYAEIITP